LTAGDKDAATLSMTETIQPRGIAQAAYRFNLLTKYGHERAIARVPSLGSKRMKPGTDVPFHFAKNSLIVGLAAKNEPHRSNSVSRLAGDFLFHPHADSYWELGVEPWFPQPGLNGQYYTVLRS